MVDVKSPLLESTPVKIWKDERGDNKIALDPNLSELDVIRQVAGTKDTEIAHNILRTSFTAISAVVSKAEGAADNADKCFNIILQSLYDFQPKDAIEARLVSQAIALYQHGMSRLGKAGSSDQIPHSEAQVNMAIKLLRVHNETIEALNRYRRGGEQKVTVTHAVVAAQAIVNNHFPGVGVPPKNQGDTPCPQENAEQKQGGAKIDHVPNQPWAMDDVDSMVDEVLAPRRTLGKDE
jgi:hypothetical protein